MLRASITSLALLSLVACGGASAGPSLRADGTPIEPPRFVIGQEPEAEPEPIRVERPYRIAPLLVTSRYGGEQRAQLASRPSVSTSVEVSTERTRSEPVMEPVIEPESEPETVLEPEPESEPESETETETESVLEPEPATEPVSEPEAPPTPEQAVVQVIHAWVDEFRACYDRTLEHEVVEGRVTMRFTVVPGGHPMDVRATEHLHPILENCLEGVIRNIRFPNRPEAVAYTYPFDFRREATTDERG